MSDTLCRSFEIKSDKDLKIFVRYAFLVCKIRIFSFTVSREEITVPKMFMNWVWFQDNSVKESKFISRSSCSEEVPETNVRMLQIRIRLWVFFPVLVVVTISQAQYYIYEDWEKNDWIAMIIIVTAVASSRNKLLFI